MNLVRTLFPKIRALFFKFWKSAEETSPPPTSSYTPDGLYSLDCLFNECRGNLREAKLHCHENVWSPLSDKHFCDVILFRVSLCRYFSFSYKTRVMLNHKEIHKYKHKLKIKLKQVGQNSNTHLKELRNRISRIIRLRSLFCSIRVYASLHFLPILLEN